MDWLKHQTEPWSRINEGAPVACKIDQECIDMAPQAGALATCANVMQNGTSTSICICDIYFGRVGPTCEGYTEISALVGIAQVFVLVVMIVIATNIGVVLAIILSNRDVKVVDGDTYLLISSMIAMLCAIVHACANAAAFFGLRHVFFVYMTMLISNASASGVFSQGLIAWLQAISVISNHHSRWKKLNSNICVVVFVMYVLIMVLMMEDSKSMFASDNNQRHIAISTTFYVASMFAIYTWKGLDGLRDCSKIRSGYVSDNVSKRIVSMTRVSFVISLSICLAGFMQLAPYKTTMDPYIHPLRIIGYMYSQVVLIYGINWISGHATTPILMKIRLRKIGHGKVSNVRMHFSITSLVIQSPRVTNMSST